MPSITVQIARRTIHISTVYDYSIKRCKPFEVICNSPDYSISITHEDIEQEVLIHRDENNEGVCNKSPAYMESLALCRMMSDLFAEEGIILMHGVVVAVNGQGYMFTAGSGVGKTTHSQLWLKTIQGSYIVSGDKPYVFVENGTAYACGTPWNGKEKYGCNEVIPLRAICRIQRSSDNIIEQIPAISMVPTLMEQSYGRPIKEVKSVLSCTSAYQLKCNMDSEAARICYEKIK